MVYGPLANGATSVIVRAFFTFFLRRSFLIFLFPRSAFHGLQFEGTPFYPENDRYWSIIDKYKVTQFYTAPTAIRSLMKFGDELVKKHSLSTLKVHFIHQYLLISKKRKGNKCLTYTESLHMLIRVSGPWFSR